MHPGPGGRCGRTYIETGPRNVRVQGQPRPDHDLQWRVRPGDDVATDVVGVVGGNFGGRAGRGGDDPFANAGRVPFDLADDRLLGVARVSAGHVGVAPDRVHVSGGAARIGEI